MKDTPPAARRNFSAEDKIRIVLDGLRGKDSIAELRRKEIVALGDAVTNFSKTKAALRVGAKHRYWPTSGSLPAQTSPASSKRESKTDLVLGLLQRRDGATIEQLVAVTGWLDSASIKWPKPVGAAASN